MRHFPLFILGAGLLLSCDNATTPTQPTNATVKTSSTPKSYSGDATAIQATILGVPTTIGHSGPLPPTGGNQSNSVLTGNIPGVLSAGLLNTSVSGQGARSQSKASV